MHYARQYCVNCRGESRKAQRAWEKANSTTELARAYSRKQVNRRHHVPETIMGRMWTAHRQGDHHRLRALKAEAHALGVAVPTALSQASTTSQNQVHNAA